jgi:hypothetical protein
LHGSEFSLGDHMAKFDDCFHGNESCERLPSAGRNRSWRMTETFRRQRYWWMALLYRRFAYIYKSFNSEQPGRRRQDLLSIYAMPINRLLFRPWLVGDWWIICTVLRACIRRALQGLRHSKVIVGISWV